MNVRAIASQLLTLFSPEERSVPDSVDYPGRNGAVLLAMNGALQVVFGRNSPWAAEDERGVVLRAPVTDVAIAVTNGSTAATITAETWQDWFAGCQIQIAGATVENRIKNAVRQVALTFPHDGPTGTTTATVWHTSLDLGADVMEVTGKVTINGAEIFPIVALPAPTLRQDDYGFAPNSYPYYQPTSGVRYLLETWTAGPTAAPSLRMRLSAAAASQAFLQYSARVVPMIVHDLASIDTLPIPLQFVQSIYYPIARQLLTGCEFYRGGGSAEEIGRAYSQALKDLDALNPAKNSGIRMTTRY